MGFQHGSGSGRAYVDRISVILESIISSVQLQLEAGTADLSFSRPRAGFGAGCPAADRRSEPHAGASRASNMAPPLPVDQHGRSEQQRCIAEAGGEAGARLCRRQGSHRSGLGWACVARPARQAVPQYHIRFQRGSRSIPVSERSWRLLRERVNFWRTQDIPMVFP